MPLALLQSTLLEASAIHVALAANCLLLLLNFRVMGGVMCSMVAMQVLQAQTWSLLVHHLMAMVLLPIASVRKTVSSTELLCMFIPGTAMACWSLHELYAAGCTDYATPWLTIYAIAHFAIPCVVGGATRAKMPASTFEAVMLWMLAVVIYISLSLPEALDIFDARFKYYSLGILGTSWLMACVNFCHAFEMTLEFQDKERAQERNDHIDTPQPPKPNLKPEASNNVVPINILKPHTPNPSHRRWC